MVPRHGCRGNTTGPATGISAIRSHTAACTRRQASALLPTRRPNVGLTHVSAKDRPAISGISTAFFDRRFDQRSSYRFASRGARKTLLPLNNVRSLLPHRFASCALPLSKKAFLPLNNVRQFYSGISTAPAIFLPLASCLPAFENRSPFHLPPSLVQRAPNRSLPHPLGWAGVLGRTQLSQHYLQVICNSHQLEQVVVLHYLT